jgi:hypothetical protein
VEFQPFPGVAPPAMGRETQPGAWISFSHSKALVASAALRGGMKMLEA